MVQPGEHTQTDGRTDGRTDRRTLLSALSPCFAKALRSIINEDLHDGVGISLGTPFGGVKTIDNCNA